MNRTMKYPGWREAEEQILNIVKTDGYGQIVLHEIIDEWLALPKPRTIQEYDRYKCERFGQIEKLKEHLLEDHGIKLQVKHGVGYEILTPDDQVKRGAKKHMNKAKREVEKSLLTLKHINMAELSTSGAAERQRQLEHSAFILVTMRKKRVELPPDARKMIEG